MQITNQFLSRIEGEEGKSPWMYLDKPGNVTAGIGRMLPNSAAAKGLRWEGQGSVEAAWVRIKASKPAMGLRYYEPLTNLRLSEDTMQAMLLADVQNVVTWLADRTSCFVAMPFCAQEALVDMGFNLGDLRLTTGYIQMMRCLRGFDYAGAARQCYRHGVSDERNAWTYNQFMAAVMPIAA